VGYLFPGGGGGCFENGWGRNSGQVKFLYRLKVKMLVGPIIRGEIILLPNEKGAALWHMAKVALRWTSTGTCWLLGPLEHQITLGKAYYKDSTSTVIINFLSQKICAQRKALG